MKPTPNQTKALQRLVRNYRIDNHLSSGDMRDAVTAAKLDVLTDIMRALGIPEASCCCSLSQSCEICR